MQKTARDWTKVNITDETVPQTTCKRKREAWGLSFSEGAFWAIFAQNGYGNLKFYCGNKTLSMIWTTPLVVEMFAREMFASDVFLIPLN